jgi:flagellar biosynthetic protein FliR
MSVTFSASFAIALTLAFARSIAWVSICPPFSNASIPTMTKVAFAGAISVFAAGTLQHDVLPVTDAQVITELVIQAGVGMVLGYVVSLFVNAVVGAGSLVDLFSGLNLPASIDPLSLQQTKLFGQFYNMVLMALLFTTGAVIVIVEGFVKSFSSVGTSLPAVTLSNLAQTITGDVVSFFAAALEIAAPIIVVLFGTQIVLALLAKAAPQINVFVFGMPLQILVGISAVGIALAALPNDITNLVTRAMTQLFGGS